MSKYHSTISRRTFMKALGFGAGAAAAATAAAPIFNDLDELTASAPKTDKPWWVKERDFNNITTPIDWDVFDYYDAAIESPNAVAAVNPEVGTAATDQLAKLRNESRPGFTIRDRALSGSTAMSPTTVARVSAIDANKKWNVSPEDNFATLKSALHYFGSTNVGAMVLDDKNKKLFSKGTTFAAEDNAGSNTNLPASCKYIIAWTIQQNYSQKRLELINKENDEHKSGIPSDLGRISVTRAYDDVNHSEYMMVRFMSGLGWQTFLNPTNIVIPYGIFAGLGELARSTHIMTPQSGICQRKVSYIVTDMPLTSRKPIDFGGTKFCETCRRCAERCPSEAMGDEKYIKPSYDRINGGRIGVAGWKIDWGKCKGAGAPGNCGSCHGLCPFNHQSEALIHPLVRITAATTPLFNKFFGLGDRFMSYAEPQTDKTLDAWWYRDYTSYKGDTIYGAGTYKWNF